MMKAVLADDEPQSCKSLAIKLKDVAENIEIIGIYNDPERAITKVHRPSDFVHSRSIQKSWLCSTANFDSRLYGKRNN